MSDYNDLLNSLKAAAGSAANIARDIAGSAGEKARDFAGSAGEKACGSRHVLCVKGRGLKRSLWQLRWGI